MRNHTQVCREFDFVAGTIFFDYNDYRTHLGDKGVGVLVVLIIFGGEVNRGFAFTFLIGTITGTYSSIYVASAIVLDYTRYKNLKAHQV